MKTKRSNRTILASSVTAILVSMFSAGYLRAGVEVAEITNEAIATHIVAQYREVARWPTDSERTASIASSADIQPYLTNFIAWAARILSPRWLPPASDQIVFGLKKWERDSGDALFAEYAAGGNTVRIRDTPTQFIVTISGNEFGEPVGDWEKYFTTICSNYLDGLEGVGRLTNFSGLYVRRCVRSGINALGVILPVGQYPYRNIWATGNPDIWTDATALTIVVTKVTAVGPFEAGFGIRQRFPPLTKVLGNASTDELVAYLVDDGNSPSEHSIAATLLRDRSDSDAVISALLKQYERTVSERAKMEVIQNLGTLAKRHGKASREPVKALVIRSLSETNSPIMNSVLQNVLKEVQQP